MKSRHPTQYLTSYQTNFVSFEKLKKIEYECRACGIWICGCSMFYKKEFWASKSAGAHSTKSLKISGCKRWCPKDLRVRATAAPVLTHSLECSIFCLTSTDATCATKNICVFCASKKDQTKRNWFQINVLLPWPDLYPKPVDNKVRRWLSNCIARHYITT